MDKYSVILAAGKGSRMKSRDINHSKVSFPILGKPLVRYVLDALEPLNTTQNVVVVGFGGNVTTEIVKDKADTVWQKELLGTGHALMQAAPLLEGKKGCTIVLCGDTPLLTSETLDNLFLKHEQNKSDLTILTAILENPKGYGRIIRDPKTRSVLAIREDRDCTYDELEVSEINSGVYVFDNELLFKYLKNIKNNNAQKEYYLTDLVSLFVNDGLRVDGVVIQDAQEIFGINDRVQLASAAKIIKKRVNKQLMLSGVSIEDPETTYISPDVVIGRDTVILPNTTILGKSIIGEGNFIGDCSYLENVVIGDNNHIIRTHIENSKVGNNNKIGPFSHISEDSFIKNDCSIGAFINLKGQIVEDGQNINK